MKLLRSAVVICAVMLMACFAGCGNNDNKEGASQSGQPQSERQESEEKKMDHPESEDISDHPEESTEAPANPSEHPSSEHPE